MAARGTLVTGLLGSLLCSVAAIQPADGGAMRLVGEGGALHPSLTFTRASGGASYDDLNRFVYVGDNTPRRGPWEFDGQGRYVGQEGEPAGTNLASNPRGIGAVAGDLGSGGALPTGMTEINDAGLTRTITPATYGGIPGFYIRWSGTPTSTSGAAIQLSEITLHSGGSYTHSVYIARVTPAPGSMGPFLLRNASDNANATTLFSGGAAASGLTRYAHYQGNSSGVSWGPVIRWQWNNTTTPVDFTIFIGGIQAERSATLTSLMLPPEGQLGPATREATPPQEINWVQNPGGEGGNSTTPERWSSITGAGLARSIVGRGFHPNGDPYVDMRFSGTASGGLLRLGLSFTADTPVMPGETWTLGLDVQILDGSLGGGTGFFLCLTRRSAASGFLAYMQSLAKPIGGTSQRISHTVTVSDPATAYLQPEIQWDTISGAASDVTLRLSRVKVSKTATDTPYFGPAPGQRGPVARYPHNGRLVVEGPRQNLWPNPRFEGATPGVVGAGGVMPTGMAAALAASQTLNVIGVVDEGGYPALELEYTGTVSGDQGVIRFEPPGGLPLAGSLPYTASLCARLVSGATTGVSFFLLRTRVNAATAQNGTGINLGTLTTAPIGDQRFQTAHTTLADATQGRMEIVIQGAATFRFRIAVPQFEQAAFASSPILPPVGVPGVSNRAQDTLWLYLTAAQAKRWTLKGSLRRDHQSTAMYYLEGWNGSNTSNYVRLRQSTGSALVGVAGVSGVATQPTAPNTTAGIVYPFTIGLDESGVAWRLGDAAPQSLGPTPPNITNIRLGAQPNNGSPMFGSFGVLDLYPYRHGDLAGAA